MNKRILFIIGVFFLSTAAALLQTYPAYKQIVESFALIAGLVSSILSIVYYIRPK